MSRLTLVALGLVACAPKFDDTRVSSDPGTFGERVVTLLCKRLAYQADPSDVSGDTYRDACRGGEVPDGAPPTILAITSQRARLVAAIDAIVPPDQTDALQTYLTSDDVLALYDDDTLGNALAQIGLMLGEMGDDADAMAALSRQGTRNGYRPANAAVGPGGPMTASPHIRDVLGGVLPTIVDGGDAKTEWDNLTIAISETLRDAAPPSEGSRPAVIAQTLLLTDYPELAEATPLPMVKRDAQGFAMLAGASDDRPSPFPTFGDASTRDDLGRAVDEAGQPVYQYFDLDRTLMGALAHDQKTLLSPDKGTAMDLVRGSSLLLGDRVATTKTFEDSGRTLDYQGYDTANAPLLDLAYAFAALLRDPQTADTLALGETLFKDHEAMISRLLEAAISTARLGDAHPEAQIEANAPLWDDLLPLVRKISADPVLVRNLIRALAKPEVKQLITRFRDFMQYKDRFDINSSQQLVGALTTEVDRTQPDSGFNRSLFERLLAVINDTNGSVECSKAGAVLREPNTGLPLHTFQNECEFYRIPNMAIFYLQTMVFAKDANGNIICESPAGEFGQTETRATPEQCTQVDDGWRPRTKANFNFQWPTVVRPLVSLQGGDQFLSDQSGIAGFGTHPTTRGLNRALFLQPRPASLNDLSDPQRDKFGTLIGEKHVGTLPVWEINNFYEQVRPVLQAFADANQESTFVDIMSVLHKHWASKESADTQHTNPNGANFTFGGNGVTWEPLLIEAFGNDLWPALTDHAAELDAIVINGKPVATVLAHTGVFLTTPQAGLADRLGRTTTTTSDGKAVNTLAPFHLLADAELAKRARLAAHPDLAAAWTDSIPELWDLWFRAEQIEGGFRFKCRHVSTVVRGSIDLIRGRLAEHSADRIAWLSTVLPQKLEDVFTSPLFAAVADFIEAQTRTGTRAALEALLADVLDPANPAAFDTMRVGAADLLQLATDDDDLVPLARLAGRLIAKDKAYLPTQLALLSRLHRADVDSTLTNIVKRLFEPNDPEAPGIPAISAVVDGAGEVDRVAPDAEASPWDTADYASIFHTVSAFMQEEQRGLPRFIVIVKGRAQ